MSEYTLAYDMCTTLELRCVIFFSQAEGGIRDHCVTGVQTCALPISSRRRHTRDRKSTRLNSSHTVISYAVFCLKKKKLHTRRKTAHRRKLRSRNTLIPRAHPDARGTRVTGITVALLMCMCSQSRIF